MRLNDNQINKILSITRQQLGGGVAVWVYGSRLDDNSRGGDIDLLINAARRITLLERADLKVALERELQIPVDIIAYQRGREPTPFQAIAMARAVRLEKAA